MVTEEIRYDMNVT